MAQRRTRSHGDVVFFFCPQCQRGRLHASPAIQQPRTLAGHTRLLDDFNFSTPPEESAVQRTNRSSRRFKCVVDAPIFPFLYDRIVPLPLHIFLGLGNQLIELVEDELTEGDDAADLAVFVGSCKTTPAGIHGAQKRAAAQALNGGELNHIVHSPQFPTFVECVVDEEMRVKLRVHLNVLRTVIPFLLSPAPLSPPQITEFRQLVNRIGAVWHRNKSVVKPKVHMLFHCVAFAEQHGHLGAYNESSMESAHHDVHLTFENHSSQGRHLAHKQRRMHSDIVQRRISRVESGNILPPPAPHLCPQCGHPSAKYLNHGQQHQCQGALN